jgi:23S rRNA (uridine2552-2'-O)-methyltransferase
LRYIDAKRDHYRMLARQKGYRSRSAFKLIQLNEKYDFLTNARVVVDLGCSPGGWLQVVDEYARRSVRAIGVDINPTEPWKNITILREDVEDPRLPEILLNMVGSQFDLVLSDLSPKVSGIWEYDQARQISISVNALRLASKILRLGASAIFKLFEGEMISDFKEEASRLFAKTITAKPNASRQQSSELYIICKNYHRC